MKRFLKEKIPLGFVYLSAGATAAVLFLILGYILFNGFFYSNRAEYPVASFSTGTMEGLVVVVNRATGVDELTYNAVQGIFTDKHASWKQVASSADDIYPYASAEAEKVARSLFGKMGRLTAVYGSADTVLRLVAGNRGGIGVLTREEYEDYLGRSKNAAPDEFAAQNRRNVAKVVRPVALRCLELAVNPSVTALFGNFKIGSVQEDCIEAIFSGKVENWKQLGGPDLPVTLVVPQDSGFYRSCADGKSLSAVERLVTLARESKSARLLPAANAEEFRSALAEIPGAAGLLPAWLGGKDTDRLNLVRVERGLNLRLSYILEKPVDGGRFGGISSIILNTLAMILLTLLLAVPPGLLAAIYLVEYAKEGRLLRILRLGTETLAGIPSIIFGLFGMLVFVQGFGWGICLLSGSLALALMILPTIVRTAEEALRSVPRSLQEGSLALGGTKIQTLFRVVLPAAFPAISAGIILATGRALGETAALIYTMGSSYSLTGGLFDSTRSLAVHLYLIVAEGISTDKAFASATVLVLMVFLINSASKLIVKRIGPGRK